MNMVNTKKEKGITLIALIVTIIVLLILAGITIASLTGDDGILTKSTEARDTTDEETINEQVNLAVLGALTMGQGKMDSSNLRKSLDNKIGKNRYTLVNAENGGWNITIKSNNKVFYVAANGKIANNDDSDNDLPSTAIGQEKGTSIKNPSTYGNNAQATADGKDKYFALPHGATYLEGTVDTGVVIDLNGSQFVWVPVDNVVYDSNQKNKLPTSETNGTTSGKTYTPMAVKVDNNYNGIYYDYTGNNAYLRYPDKVNYVSTYYREPDVVSDYDGGSYDYVGITKDKLQQEYNDMIESVLKYKGFYVARYEAGVENENIVFKDASGENSTITTADARNLSTKTWYGLYSKIKGFTTANDSVVSSMIWGSQYDAMMNWMAKNGTSVGNKILGYNNTTKTGGSKNTDVINNIYDLYGCHEEWTLEASHSIRRVIRGGTKFRGRRFTIRSQRLRFY